MPEINTQLTDEKFVSRILDLCTGSSGREDPEKLEKDHERFLKEFLVFLESRNRSRYTAFRDFLTFFVRGWCISDFPEKWKYGKNETLEFVRMSGSFGAMALRLIADRGWFDLPGEIYIRQVWTASDGKAGIAYTPPHICNLMADLSSWCDKDNAVNNGTMLDPCCGSGRFALAHANNQGYDKALVKCMDLSDLAVYMATVNFLLHGVRGIVACGNALSPHDFSFGFCVNSAYHTEGQPLYHTPHCSPMTGKELESCF